MKPIKTSKKYLLLCLGFLAIGNAMGQSQETRKIMGHVSDTDGNPVIHATIKAGEQVVAMTDENGNFSLSKLPSNVQSVTISYIGMRSVQSKLSPSMNVTMQWDNTKLDEVMVVAYGTAKRSSYTGSVTTIGSSEINKLQTSNPVNALKGRAPGVQIYSTSGSPDGGSPTLRIRGISSINSGNAPLIIVDGAPYVSDLSSVNPQDIETLSVLKDAASAALYGARGANGVIIITTKRAKNHQGVNVTFDAKWGANQVAQQRYETIDNAAEYYQAYHRALRNENLYENLNEEGGFQMGDDKTAYEFANKNLEERLGYISYTVPKGENLILENGLLNPNAQLGRIIKGLDNSGKEFNYLIKPDNWYALAYRPSLRQEYNITATKSNDKSNIYFSVGYLDNVGVLDNTDFKKLNTRLKAEWDAKKWLKLNANISYTNLRSHSVGGEGDFGNESSVFGVVNNIAPIYPAYLRDEKGNILVDHMGFTRYDYGQKKYLPINRPFLSMSNPISDNKLNYGGDQIHTLNVNGGVELKLGRGFKFASNNTLNLIVSRGERLNNPYYGPSAESSKGTIYIGSLISIQQNIQQLLTYSKDFGGVHSIEALIGHEYYRSTDYELAGSKSNLVDNVNHELSGGIEDGKPSSDASLYNTEGWFTRANYSLLNRYFVSASLRRDASSRFHPNYQWGNFWSISAAWNLTREPFFKVKWINALKLKASYGEQGNDGFSDYLYTTTYTFKNSHGSIAIVPNSLGNEDISWEKSANLNLGVEFSLFNGRFNGQIEVFNRETHDMISNFSLARSYGFNNYYANLGNMRNHGVEVELNAELIHTNKFSWTFGVNFTHYKNSITAIPEQRKTREYEGHYGYESGDFFYGEGLPMGTRYLYKSAGIDPKTGEMLYYTWAPRYDTSKPVTVEDADGHKVQKRDRWGELVYEPLEKVVLDEQGNPTYDDNGNVVKVPAARDRLTKTTDVSEASYFLGKSSHPDLYGGFNTNLTYAGFDLGLDFSFQIGGYILDRDYYYLMTGLKGASGGLAIHKDVLNKTWSPSNRNAQYPRIQTGNAIKRNLTPDVDTYYTSASFLSLNNINLGYTMPKNILKQMTKGQVNNMRLYVSVDNVYYWTARKGLDPRQSLTESTKENYAPVRTISGGLTLTF